MRTKSLSPEIHPGCISMEPCCPLVKRKETVFSMLSNETRECVGVHKEETNLTTDNGNSQGRKGEGW